MVGDLEGGLHAMLASFHANYDVVISRGGTAQVLEEQISIPVIGIELSALDVMRQMRELRYDLVLCDKISHEVAEQLGIDSQLLASGADSIRRAFELAVFYCKHWHLERERSKMLWDITRNQPRGLVLYLHGGGLFYSNLTGEDKAIYPFLESHLYDTRSRRLVFRNGGIVYNVSPFKISSTEEPIVGFGINVHREPALAHPGITHHNAQDIHPEVAQSFFCRSGADASYRDAIEAATSSGQPIYIRGEVGTGKSRIAQLAYLASDYATSPLVSVDLELVGERGMRYLTESYHSPLYEGSQAIFLRGVQAIPGSQWRSLLTSLLESGATRRNLVILSGNDSSSGAQSEAAVTMSLRLNCHVIEARSLREDGAALLDEADCYLRSLRVHDDPEVAPLSPEAQDRLLTAIWPLNHSQLRRVLERAHRLAGDGTVSTEQLGRAIGHEEVSGALSTPFNREGIDLLKPLATTEREIATLVVMRCEGNKSLAARTLGISRTTLWRLLRDEGERA